MTWCAKVLGTRFEVECDDREVERALGAQLHELSAPLSTAPPDVRYRIPDAATSSQVAVHRDGAALEDAWRGPLPYVVNRLLSEIVATAIERFDGFAVHAGVVASDRGAVVLPGPSGTGKSTLTAACLRHGLRYLSDEALCVRWGEADAVPLPKPLTLDGRAGVLLGLVDRPWDGEQVVRATSLGAVAAGPVDVSDLVVLVRSGATRAALESVPPGDAAETLLRMSFNAYRSPRDAVVTATRLAERARCWRLVLGTPDDAAARLVEAVASG